MYTYIIIIFSAFSLINLGFSTYFFLRLTRKQSSFCQAHLEALKKHLPAIHDGISKLRAQVDSLPPSEASKAIENIALVDHELHKMENFLSVKN